MERQSRKEACFRNEEAGKRGKKRESTRPRGVSTGVGLVKKPIGLAAPWWARFPFINGKIWAHKRRRVRDESARMTNPKHWRVLALNMKRPLILQNRRRSPRFSVLPPRRKNKLLI